MRPRAAIGALLAVALVSAAAAHAGPKPRVGIAGEWLSADSIRVTASWTEVRDARGGAVTYSWAFHENGIRVASGSTTALSESRTFARPLAGDTARYVADVYAVDSRGKASATAQSAVLLVITPWTPPPPPVIQIDTVAYEPGHPDGLQNYLDIPTWGGRVDGARWSMALGDTVTMCALLWQNGHGLVPSDLTFRSTPELALTPKPGGCVLVTALVATEVQP